MTVKPLILSSWHSLTTVLMKDAFVFLLASLNNYTTHVRLMFDFATLVVCSVLVLLVLYRVAASYSRNLAWLLAGRTLPLWNHWPYIPPAPFIGISPFLRQNVPIFVTYHELARRYGDIFVVERNNSNVVIVNGPSAVREFLSKGRAVSSRPLLRRIQLHNPHFLGLSDTPYCSNWKEQRKFCMSKLRYATTIATFDKVLQNEIKCVITEFSKSKRLLFDPLEILQNCVSGMICSVVLGKTFQMGDKSFVRLVNLIRDSLELTTKSSLSNKISWFQKLRQRADDEKLVNVREELMRFIQTYVDEEDVSAMHNDFSILSEFSEQMRKGTKESFTREQRLYLLLDLFNGGSETTVLTLQWALLYMTNNPECQRRMHAELDIVSVNNELVSHEDCSKLPYCEAVLLEVQRKASVVPLSLPHLTLEDVTIDGKIKIPANSTVMTNLWSAHQDTSTWARPWNFRPENFLNTDLKIVNKDKLMQFSFGNRRCVGEHLAKVTMFAFFANIMKHFTLLPPPGVATLPEEGVFRTTHACKNFQLRAIPRFDMEI